ncbi:ParB N-terminal domain-containing protein [Microbacterium sp. F2E]|uniref:ParB N-terminal domain-containing protein n=1 Tax=Microbacterium sp. F2E TaxID=2895284 RepID=UPI001E422A1C|nr:ParB N-terminal domain-containing protein [Microbacterium sp. F2E]MCC9053516.1 ParB N-terminal domain-containing protein [Microbacterium sp. F2E]
MSNNSGEGHVELERATDSIWAGRRHRQDMGDMNALVASIERDGMLQPITIAPNGMLICGARRLLAVRTLGWKTVKVWVRSGISTRLGELLAEQDDNLLHKPLTSTEELALYRELKELMGEDAARRQEASRFTTKSENPRSHGGAESAPPSGETAGRTRAQAAQMVTGRASYTRLEEFGRIHDTAADPTQPAQVRARAQAEVDAITAGAPVHPALGRVNAAAHLATLDALADDDTQPAGVREAAAAGAARVRELEAAARADELERIAAQAVQRARAATKRRRPTTPRSGTGTEREAGGMVLLPVRSFVYLWDDLDSWWDRYDPAMIGPALAPAQWAQFERILAGTLTFADAARAARDAQERKTA